jgi:hypothetical protein
MGPQRAHHSGFAAGVVLSSLLAGACGDDVRLQLDRRLNPPDRNSYEWVRLHSCRDQMARARFTWRSYENLLTALQNERYLVVPLRELVAARAQYPGKVVVGLRHDMDGNFCKAVTMAELEKRMGVRSTYFVNHTERYYGYGWPHPQRIHDILPYLRRMQALGHEIGLHNDTITMAWKYGFEPSELLTVELAYLRWAGLTVDGTSAHGSDEAREYHFSNYELFAGMTKRTTLERGKRRIALGAHTLAEFGLSYEAYHLGYEDYASDVGGRWSTDPLEALAALEPGESAVLLTHPQWWGAEDPADSYY